MFWAFSAQNSIKNAVMVLSFQRKLIKLLIIVKYRIMANTTDLMITSFFDDAAIVEINKKTGLDFKKISKSDKCGGSHVVCFEVYATCKRSIGSDNINKLIDIFKKAKFTSPEYSKLFIDCDSNEGLSGVYSIS